MISDEEASKIKAQIIEHVEKTFPEEKKESAIEKIHSMNSEELEEFVEKNGLMGEDGQKCIFCSIVSGEADSFKISEDKNAIAVLEINPLSRGHVLVIPKEHSEKISKPLVSFANRIAKKIKSKLSAKEVKMQNSVLLGHAMINLIPIYENESLKKERSPAKKEELGELQKILAEKKKKTLVSKKEQHVKKIEEKIWLPRRRP